ncbi:MAG: hypothetical protein A07HB70_02371 [uncultured archaeon A07HB70]|jgi:hypothetical protein|nr:MAG: hypothetical protein A07HB70_02371 [uncultured archaeon A07HB70]
MAVGAHICPQCNQREHWVEAYKTYTRTFLGYELSSTERFVLVCGNCEYEHPS